MRARVELLILRAKNIPNYSLLKRRLFGVLSQLLSIPCLIQTAYSKCSAQLFCSEICTSSNDNDIRLQSLEETIIEREIKFIVVDSIAAIARREFDSKSIRHRQASLGKQAALLKLLAENFHIPVLVTNQVTTARSGRTSFSFTSRMFFFLRSWSVCNSH